MAGRAQEADLLPVGYFHVVFTLPAEVADIAFYNKALVYDLLFKAASETMLTIAADPKHLGARIGITAVLHTWGSAMTHHPHVHMIVPGGGIAPDVSRWISSRPAFLLPVRVLGASCSDGSSSRRLLDSARRRAAGLLRHRWYTWIQPPSLPASPRFRSAQSDGSSMPRRRSPGRRRCSPTSRATPTGSRSRTAASSPSTSTEHHLPLQGLPPRRRGPAAGHDPLRPTSSSAASCSTSCRAASTASGITVCWPAPLARPVSRSPANSWMSPRRLMPTHQSNRSTTARHAAAAADA
jgi:hypothetical protein